MTLPFRSRLGSFANGALLRLMDGRHVVLFDNQGRNKPVTVLPAEGRAETLPAKTPVDQVGDSWKVLRAWCREQDAAPAAEGGEGG